MTAQGELNERYSVASESGSSTDSHTETTENKDGEWLRETLIMFCGFISQTGFCLLYFCLCSEEKIWCRFDVQQPDEHWQEKTLGIREP